MEDSEGQRSILEGRRIARLDEQSLAVERRRTAAQTSAPGPIHVAHGRPPPWCGAAVPVNVEAFQHPRQLVARPAVLFLGISRVVRQRQFDGRFLIDRLDGAQGIAHGIGNNASLGVIGIFVVTDERRLTEQFGPQIGSQHLDLDGDAMQLRATADGQGQPLIAQRLRPFQPVGKGSQLVIAPQAGRDDDRHRARAIVQRDAARDDGEQDGLFFIGIHRLRLLVAFGRTRRAATIQPKQRFRDYFLYIASRKSQCVPAPLVRRIIHLAKHRIAALTAEGALDRQFD